MELSRDFSFDYVISNFNDFTNIDIKAVIGRKDITEQWKLIFLKIALSNKSKMDIEAEHEEFNNAFPNRSNETGKLVSWCLPIDELSSFFEQIDSGTITIGDELIDCGSNLDLRNTAFRRYQNYFTRDNEYTYWVGFAVHNGLTETFSRQIGFNEGKMRLRFTDLNDWLDIPSRDWKNTSAKVVILIPIQIKKESIARSGESTLTINYSIATSLLPKIEPVIRIYYNDREQKKIISNLAVQSANNVPDLYSTVRISLENIQVGSIQKIESVFYHSVLDDDFFTDSIVVDLSSSNDSNLLSELVDLDYDKGIDRLQERSYMTRPDTPYTNIRLMNDTLEKCKSYIHWVDKYFSQSNLDFLARANLCGKVRELKLLGSIAICDEYLKSEFKRFKRQMQNKGISCEMRIIVDRKLLSDLHDRWILSENINFNAVSGDTVKRGQYAEISVTFNNPPFGEWWESSLNLINNFGVIIEKKIQFDQELSDKKIKT